MLLPSFEASDFYEHLEPVELAYASLLRTWKFSFLKDDVEDSLPHGNMFPLWSWSFTVSPPGH